MNDYIVFCDGFVKKKVDKRSTTINKSIINNLTHKGIINNSLLVLINNLTLEDLIAIKLELSCAYLKNRLYGFNLWHSVAHISREAVLKFAISTTYSKKDAARFLGLSYVDFKKLIKKYKIEEQFNNENSN